MKTCALYGFIITLASAFLTLVLYFLGLHSDPAKISLANGIASVVGIAIGIGGTTLGVGARRKEIPASEEFGYGRAFGAGVLISVVSSFLNAIFSYIYMAFINPGFQEVILQAQAAKLQAAGLSSDQIEKTEKVTRFFSSPGISSVFQVLVGVFFGVIIALIIAAFMKRPASAALPPVQA